MLSCKPILLLLAYFNLAFAFIVPSATFTSPDFFSYLSLFQLTTTYDFLILIEPNQTRVANWVTFLPQMTLPFDINNENGLLANLSISNPTLQYIVHLSLQEPLTNITQLNIVELNEANNFVDNNVSFVDFGNRTNFFFQVSCPPSNCHIIIYINKTTVIEQIRVLNKQTSDVSLYYSPSNLELFIVTDVNSTSDVVTIDNYTEVLLKFNNTADKRCYQSLGSETNPAMWVGYRRWTNFTFEQTRYRYFLTQIPSQISEFTDPTKACIKVTGIYLDCTTILQFALILQINNDTMPTYLTSISYELNSSFPSPFYPRSNGSTNVSVFEQPVFAYLQITGQKNITLIYEYDIISQQLNIVIPNTVFHYFNAMTNLVQFSANGNDLIIDNVTCNNLSSVSSKIMYFANSTIPVPIYQNSSVQLTFLPYYIRDPVDRKLYEINATNRQGVEFFLRNYTDINITYYQQFEKIHVIVSNIFLRSYWYQNYTTSTLNIYINNTQVGIGNITLAFSPSNKIQMEVDVSYLKLDRKLKPLGRVNVQFNQDFVWDKFLTPELYRHRWYVQKQSLTIIYYDPPEVKIIAPQQISQAFLKSLQIGQYGEKGWRIFLFSYLINNYVAFQNLAFLYFFAPLRNPVNIERKQISDATEALQNQASMMQIVSSFLSLDINFNYRLISFDPLTTLEPIAIQLNFSSFSYSLDFIQNNLQGISLILMLIFKIGLTRVLCCIPWPLLNKILRKILAVWKQVLCIQILMSAPQIFVIFGLYLKVGLFYNFFADKINLIANFTLILIILLAFFSFVSIKQQYRKASDRKVRIKNNLVKILIKNESKILKKQRKLCELLISITDNLMYLLIPFAIGTQSRDAFIITATLITTTRLIIIIAIRRKIIKIYGMLQFFNHIVDKLLWFCFNFIYLLYWITEVFDIDVNSGQWIQTIKICDTSQSLLFIGGCIVQLALSLLNFLFFIGKIILKKCIRRSQIADGAQIKSRKKQSLQVEKQNKSINPSLNQSNFMKKIEISNQSNRTLSPFNVLKPKLNMFDSQKKSNKTIMSDLNGNSSKKKKINTFLYCNPTGRQNTREAEIEQDKYLDPDQGQVNTNIQVKGDEKQVEKKSREQISIKALIEPKIKINRCVKRSNQTSIFGS